MIDGGEVVNSTPFMKRWLPASLNRLLFRWSGLVQAHLAATPSLFVPFAIFVLSKGATPFTTTNVFRQRTPKCSLTRCYVFVLTMPTTLLGILELLLCLLTNQPQ